MIEFVVHGIPAPKGSKRAFVVKGRAVTVDDNKPTLRDWTRQVNDVVQGLAERGKPTLDGPLVLEVDFYLPRPKSAPKSRLWPDRKPDLDKLLRALLDPLVKCRIVADDARFVKVIATKRYGALPRAEVLIGRLVESKETTEAPA